ncbi:MAG: hypothetical protein CVV41_05110 [Candidatus Riflebacteria bacterium HGW-Riflebacteria-1]|jgi:hypothetical protein|nr:MAG: hypothetical protein CVV41_05110 [Candidatus Riflebacteria bacterium HGW-Riflebacteria-1]
MNPFEFFDLFDTFEWDDGNLQKNIVLHDVSPFECEEIFFNFPVLIKFDQKHSQAEKRYFALGRTDRNRFLFVGVVLRNRKVRVITGRDMNKKEVRIYEDSKKRNSPV